MLNFFKKEVSKEELDEVGAHLKSINRDEIKWTEQDRSFWEKNLTPMQFKVRYGGTERAFTGELWDNKEKGEYLCSNCGEALFSSGTKFDSGTGWPSFYDKVNDVIDYHEDKTLLRVRTEVKCKNCHAHLGHVFEDGPQPTGKRYCINSVSLMFKKSNE